MADTFSTRPSNVGYVSQDSATTFLLGVGALAGPMFIAAVFLQSVVRNDINTFRDPISALSLGTYGWVHQVCFVLAGILCGFAVLGCRRTDMSKSRPKVDIWLRVTVVGFIGAGVLVTDAPNQRIADYWSMPYSSTVEGWLHVIFAMLTFLGLAEAAKSQRQQDGRWGQFSRWTYLIVMVTAVLSLIAFVATPAPLVPIAGMLQRIANATGLIWLTAYCMRQMPRKTSSII